MGLGSIAKVYIHRYIHTIKREIKSQSQSDYYEFFYLHVGNDMEGPEHIAKKKKEIKIVRDAVGEGY